MSRRRCNVCCRPIPAGSGRCEPCHQTTGYCTLTSHEARLASRMPGRSERVAELVRRADAKADLWAAGLPAVGG